jgi:hypothetical protein
MSVHKKLMQARVDLLSIELKKSGRNTFQNYSYFELGDFIPHIQTIFNNVGLCGVVSFNTEYAQLCITDVDDGTVIVITSPMADAALKGAQPIQLMGSIQTYQRRYLWMAAMELTEHDTIDMTPTPDPAKTVLKPEPDPSPVQELKPPTKHGKGRVDPIPPQYEETLPKWTIIIDAPDDESWVDMFVEANNLNISMAENTQNLKDMFQVSKGHYEKLKNLNPSVHSEVMDNFAKAKKSFF